MNRSLLTARISAHAGRTAIISPEGTFTYRDLDAASCRVASGLLAGRLDLDGARVAFFAPPGIDYVATLLGIWRAGGIAVPLAVSYPPAELDYVIRDAQAEIVVSTSQGADVLRPLAEAADARFALTTDLLTSDVGSPECDVRSVKCEGREAPDRRALILYTSGTTGKPKGVVTTHANIEAQISALVEAWEWTADDRILLVLPLHHVHGLINVVGCALWVGATCEMAARFDGEMVWDRLASSELTVFTAVPTIYHRLIALWDEASPATQRDRSSGCRALRVMMSGSAALPVRTLERWREISGHTLLERYGMTEIAMALANPLHGARQPGRVGAPLPGVTVRVVDEHGHPVPAGTPGEVEVQGSGVFLEYWRRPEETSRAFRDGWFRTGDVAVVEEGGYRLLGRTSIDIIKTGGYKVSALEIEEVMREHPAVAECAVVGMADAMWGEKICAAVELRPNATLTLDDLQNWAKSRLAPYKIPRVLRQVPTLPRNAMGKVVKPDVVALFQSEAPR